MFDGTTGHRIALTHSAVAVGEKLGNDEQGNTLGALGRVWQASQYDMDDVLGHVMLTGGNEDLGAGDAVGTVRVRLGLGFQNTQVRTTVRFGQAHGAGPLTAGQLRQVAIFLLVGTVLFNGRHRTVGQARVHAPGPVGGTGHFRDSDASGAGQALTAEFRVAAHGRPAAFHILGVGFLETFRRGYHTVVETTAFLITGTVQGSQLVFGELGAFFQEGIQQFAVDLFQTQPLVMAVHVQDFIQYKAHIAQGSLVIRHLKSP